MNGTLRPDLANFVGIGIIGFLTVWLVNRGLRAAGKPQWTTGGA